MSWIDAVIVDVVRFVAKLVYGSSTDGSGSTRCVEHTQNRVGDSVYPLIVGVLAIVRCTIRESLASATNLSSQSRDACDQHNDWAWGCCKRPRLE